MMQADFHVFLPTVIGPAVLLPMFMWRNVAYAPFGSCWDGGNPTEET